MQASRKDEERQTGLYQALRREVDERSRELGADEPVELACECTNPGCQELVSLTSGECEYIHRVPNRLVVRIGHVDTLNERVIMEEPGRFQVIERFGPDEDVVAHFEPRRRGWTGPRD